jgi:hypothetical protein
MIKTTICKRYVLAPKSTLQLLSLESCNCNLPLVLLLWFRWIVYGIVYFCTEQINIWHLYSSTVIVAMKEGSWQFPCLPLTKFKSSKESCHVSNCNVISWNRPFHYFPYLAQYIIQLTATSSHCLETMTKKECKMNICVSTISNNIQTISRCTFSTIMKPYVHVDTS